ncbi:hypothetical protein [Methanosphaera sp. BMS]|uniref:hypothetical protein n=1 Tax=Methanosphaera sp. BMS TaxID=1789762 RepID=UPI000DC1F4D9|nr:hypothetical protein [Methanosphaera sp. BMS]AWX32217.1 hypothetical protein AW729_03470 [Methanosphaera sp. BMS]
MEVKSIDEINDIYSSHDVVLEECILESDDIYYSICRINALDVYDVLLVDRNGDELINFESRMKLSGSTLRYFHMYAGDEYCDGHGNVFRCMSHYVLIND